MTNWDGADRGRIMPLDEDASRRAGRPARFLGPVGRSDQLALNGTNGPFSH